MIFLFFDKILKDMHSFNIDVKLEEIFTPVPVAKNFIQEKNLRPFVLVEPGKIFAIIVVLTNNITCLIIFNSIYISMITFNFNE